MENTITVKNTGSITLTDIIIVDAMLEVNEKATLVANETKTIT